MRSSAVGRTTRKFNSSLGPRTSTSRKALFNESTYRDTSSCGSSATQLKSTSRSYSKRGVMGPSSSDPEGTPSSSSSSIAERCELSTSISSTSELLALVLRELSHELELELDPELDPES